MIYILCFSDNGVKTWASTTFQLFKTQQINFRFTFESNNTPKVTIGWEYRMIISPQIWLQN